MSHRRTLDRLKKLEALTAPVEPHRIEVCRATDSQAIYSVGAGCPHQVFAMESQLGYLQALSSRLDLSIVRQELLLGDRRSGTSWAGLVATVSLAVANVRGACVFVNPYGLKDTHELLRSILPAVWVDKDAEERGFYRLPRQVKLHVVSYEKRKSWPEHCGVVMLNDYAYASEETIEAVLREGQVRLVTGNPPLDDQPGQAWVLRERDRAKAAGTLFRFHAKQNQVLRGNPAHLEQLNRLLISGSAALRFWDTTGL